MMRDSTGSAVKAAARPRPRAVRSKAGIRAESAATCDSAAKLATGTPSAESPQLRRRAARFAGLGLSDADIAVILDLDEASLADRFGREIARGRILANALVARALLRRAIGSGPNAVSAAIFWLRNRSSWGDEPGPADAGEGADPVRVTFRIDDPRDDGDPAESDFDAGGPGEASEE